MESSVRNVRAEPSTGTQSLQNSHIKLEPSDAPHSFASFALTAPAQDAGHNGAGNDAFSSAFGTGTSMPISMSEDDWSKIVPKETNYLERLCNGSTLDSLESGVSVASRLLSQVQDALGPYKGRGFDSWIQAIVDLEKHTVPTSTIVGVVGNTGAGKSSVINAVLDEERLLPTNCLRACTASPTEISFNYSDAPDELYRAEIEFITVPEWTRELQALFSELLDGSGQICREASNVDSDAGVAYAKVKAVYPQKTREMLAKSSAERLAKEPAVQSILGTTKLINAATAKQLYKKLQHYVDSKEKSAGNVDRRKRGNVEMEYWPLIKVVRIFTKAQALSTGAVIVDLPGVQDSNQARAAVAASYMKSCTGLWIVAPITRAVDDKTAKSLLGDSFKRQLKYDGTYSAVSFICSKTDDISITEAAESLDLETETTNSWNVAEEMKYAQETILARISDLKEAEEALDQEIEECETKTDTWEDIQSRISGGETVYEPSANAKKRKRGGKAHGARKRFGSSTESDEDSSDDDWSDKENSQPEQNGKPLTEEEVEKRLSLLRTRRKEIRGEKRSLNSQMAGLLKNIEEIENKREKILAEVKAICIQGRNAYSRGAIKQDFAMGIKEMDQETAMEEDEMTFNPDQDIRDYDEVARSLPVFCVSSRAYQKLSGRLEKDDFQSHGFLSVEDTEIPQLQEHAKKLTEGSRRSYCRRFLNDFSQLVNSMSLWSADDGSGLNLTDGEKFREEQHLKKMLARLSQALDLSVKQSTTLMKRTLEEYIFETIKRCIPAAIEVAPSVAYSWGAPRSEGGLLWATYKATVRRQGYYSGFSGPQNFNEDLSNLITKNLITVWERAFQRRLPLILEDLANQIAVHLEHFHHSARARAERRQTNAAGLMTLSNQIIAHIRIIRTIPMTMGQRITAAQREASRQFIPVICRAMNDAYTICTNESGQGSYMRMKDAMMNHVNTIRYSMFQEATNAVKSRLVVMCETVEKETGILIKTVFDKIYIEYMCTLVGAEIDWSRKLSSEELQVKRHINEILRGCDQLFGPATGTGTFAMQPPMDTARTMDDGVTLGSPEAMGNGMFLDDPEAHTHIGYATENEVSVHRANELMQTHIQKQDQAQKVKNTDPFAYDDDDDDDDEFPDVMDLFKKEPGR